MDKASSWLKRLYFHYVFLPLNRFSYAAFDLLPPNAREHDGRLCWTEHEGAYETEWEAEQEAMKYPYGHALKVPLNGSLSSETVNTEQLHPNSPPEVRTMYEHKAVKSTVEVSKLDLVKLAAKIASTDGLVEQFQTKAT